MDLDSVDHPGRFFSLLARDLKSLAISNIQFFENGKQSHHAKFHMSFSLLYEYLDIGIEPSYRELSKYLHLYDFSPDVKGNGYRSLLQVVHKCCLHLLQLSRYIASVKDSMLFRKKYYAKELEAYVSALGQLRAILYYALKLVHYCQEGELFADEEKLDNAVADHLMMEVESLNQECFYGRCLGFQFCESMMRPVQIMNIAMASYSEGYLESSSVMQVATSVFNSGKYFMDPELRATQLAKVTRTADIQFCKAFWSISESGVVQQLPSMVCPSVEVNEFFPLGPDAFELPLVDGSDTVVITPPCAHIGPGHVMVRLLSAQLREGQQTFLKSSKAKSPVGMKPRTPGLIIHIHGGGFIAQSSKSHEMYLRDWARIVDIPILSVDYSLAPELPFPRALEDCFYAYAWAVKNCLQLGSLGERIVMCGDSAGGNLAISTAMRAASFDIRRPDGVLAVYPVTMVRYLPSPARLLSLMDPILPVGIVSRCLAAYAGINEEHPLASPSTQDFQSKSSLNTIQMQTAESSENEWVIIGQDKDECDQIGMGIDHSPTPTSVTSPNSSLASKSIIDSLEDSFHEESAQSAGDFSAMGEAHRKFHRSDTMESDEVEIFSQLQVAGSCVFSKEDKTAENRSKENRNVREIGNRKDDDELNKDKVNVGTADALTENLISIQETAKSVMEGAQNMLTSLSSFIPSRGSASTTISNPASVSFSKSGEVITKSTDFYVNRSISSDAVDPTSLGKSDDDCISIPNTSRSDEFPNEAASSIFKKGERIDLVDGKSQSLSFDQSYDDETQTKLESDRTDETLAGEYVTAELNLEKACNHDDDDDHDNDRTKLSGSDISLDKNINSSQSRDINSQNQTSPPSAVTHVDGIAESVSNHPPPLTPPPTPDKTQIVQSVSSYGDSDHNNKDHNFDSISLASDDGDFLTVTKPTVGTSPIVETLSNDNNIFSDSQTTVQLPSSPLPPSIQEQTTTIDSNLAQSLSSPISLSQNSSVSREHQDSTNPPSFFPTCVPSSSPSSSPTGTTTTMTTTSTSHNPLQPLTVSQSTNAGNLSPTAINNTWSNTPDEEFLTPADHIPEQTNFKKDHNLDTEDWTSSPSSNDPTLQLVTTLSTSSSAATATPPTTASNHNIINITQNSNTKISPQLKDHQHSIPLTTNTSATTTTVPPKPPSNLNLFPTTTNANNKNVIVSNSVHNKNPSPSQSDLSPASHRLTNHDHSLDSSPSPDHNIFAEHGVASDIESTDTETDIPAFNASCLQFLGPSPMPNDEAYYASHLVGFDTETKVSDGIFKSDSVPAFSTLLSPMSPVDSESKKSNQERKLPFPNGLKMGMSPSDFKRQTFTTHSPVNTMRKALVVRNPYMSPLMAEPHLLRGLPPVCIVASHLDPLLDDSVMFAKRLQRLDMPVELHLVDDLPHGFLNFSMISQEAKKASQFCANKLLEMINKQP